MPHLNRRRLLASLTLASLPGIGLAAKQRPAPAGVWPRALAVPGGVARLSLGPAAQRPRVQVRQGDADVPVLVVGDAIEWTAVLGIPLAAPTGDAHVTVLPATAEGQARQVHYTVAPKRYAEQQLTVSPRTEDLSPQDQARYERERDQFQKRNRITFNFTYPNVFFNFI